MGTRSVEVLKQVDFELHAGELLAIMGASGSGKTTLMNIIGLLDRPSAGNYLLEGKEVSGLTDDARAHIRNQSIGFVFQSFFLLPRLSALQNVGLPLIYRGIHGDELIKRSSFELSKVGMSEHVEHKPNELSGGQQQRVAIARALVGSPKVILADEPTGALDSATGEEVMGLFKNLNKKDKTTIVIVTHDPLVAEQCQRIVHIKDGRVIEK